MLPARTLFSMIFAILPNFFYSQALQYSEVVKWNGPCYPRDSCYSRSPDKDHLWGDRVCECGPHCLLHGTCCADSSQIGPKLNVPQPENVKCQKPEAGNHSVMMVSQCSVGWDWKPEVKEKCENGVNLTKDSINMMVPLTNIITQTTYKNYFCAVCNYGGDYFLYWKLFLKNNNSETVQRLNKLSTNELLKSFFYKENLKSWGFLDEDSKQFYAFKVKYKVPAYLYKFVKKCHENIVETCKSAYNSTQLEKNCRSYYSPVEFRTNALQSAVFRNVHCALCNDVDVKPATVHNNSCKLKGFSRNENETSSVANGKWYDLNRSDGDQVDPIKDDQIKMTSVPIPDCGINKKWDPCFRTCRQLVLKMSEVHNFFRNGYKTRNFENTPRRKQRL